jgi:hypothetical protein
LETNVFTLEIIVRGAPNNDKPLTTHDNTQLTNRRRLREAEPRLISSQPAHRTRCCTTLKQQAAMLRQPEAARSVAAPGLYKPANRTRCCTAWKQQAAMLRQPEAATHNNARLSKRSPLRESVAAPKQH